jgi:hypothetical protein
VYKPEIDEVLARHLGRVSAPEELWERIENPQVSARVRTRHRGVHAPRFRALLVLATLIIIAVVFQTRRRTVEVESRLPQRSAACFLCHAGG